MTYDRKSRTINLDPGSDFMADSGVLFITMLRDLAKDPSAKQSARNDWKVIEEWLGCEGRELTPEDDEKIGKSWRAYLAIGVAPSHDLQPAYDQISKDYKASGQYDPKDKPPESVMDVFDRLQATEDEIKRKKSWDWSEDNPEMKKLADAIRKVSSHSKPSATRVGWWRRQSQSFRSWTFISVAWAAASLFYILVFDPFELGDWRWAEGKDYLKVISISAAPAILALLKKAYDRIV